MISKVKFETPLACDGNRVRFEDNCFEAAGSTIANIMVNVDVCKHKNGELWVPRTSAEHHFVTQTFQSPNNLYHLGVVKYMVCISMYIVSIVVVYYESV